MTEKITREQIEAWRQEARYSHHDVMTVKFTPDELIALCTLALQAEAMQPRPIEEADETEGLHILGYDSGWSEMHFTNDGWYLANNDPTDHWGRRLFPTHFIPLTSLPEPRR